MTWHRKALEISYISYNPYKSNVFSLGLCLFSVCGLDIQYLNHFGINYDIFITAMLTINYDYIAKDSLKQVSNKLLRNELQNNINKKINEFPYNFLNRTLRKMLEVDIVDIVERVTIDEVYEDAQFYAGIFD